MKTFQLTVMIAFLGVMNACSQTDTLKVKTSAQCSMCKETIETALVYEKGVKKADVQIPGGITTIVYNKEKISPEKIRTVISMVGYDADSVKAVSKTYDKLPACCKKPDGSSKVNH